MPGIPGSGGPPPKRSDQRRRKNVVTVEKAASVPSVMPAVDPDWHPVAVRWFESLPNSGQAVFYEASDWATAYMVAESMSREFNPQVVGLDQDRQPVWAPKPPSGASLSAWLKAMSSLLVTEGDRRRLRLELQKPEPVEDPDEARAVAELNDYRSRFAG